MSEGEIRMEASPSARLQPRSVPLSEKTANTVCELGTVDFRTEKFTLNWTILNYSNWNDRVDSIKSPTFCFPGSVKWCLEFAKARNDIYGWTLCFHLLSSQSNPSVIATVKASLISSSGKKYEAYPATNVRLQSTKVTQQVNVSQILNKESDFMKALTFEGEVSVPLLTTEPNGSIAVMRQPQSSTADLVASVAALLNSEDLSDVVLCAGDTELKAHRAVLSARSPVFAAMLRHDTKESQSGRINIQDVDPDTLREVLRFIYTGSAPHLEKLADKLLTAADKYNLPLLKELCEVHLARNLTVDTAAATGVLALHHSCDFLQQAAISFIKENLVAVLGTDGWVTAVTEHPAAIAEISLLIADQTAE